MLHIQVCGECGSIEEKPFHAVTGDMERLALPLRWRPAAFSGRASHRGQIQEDRANAHRDRTLVLRHLNPSPTNYVSRAYRCLQIPPTVSAQPGEKDRMPPGQNARASGGEGGGQ